MNFFFFILFYFAFISFENAFLMIYIPLYSITLYILLCIPLYIFIYIVIMYINVYNDIDINYK